MSGSVIFPELLGERDDDVDAGVWTVRKGTTMRGGASCNLVERVLHVPLDSSDTARVVRAHELMHARVSPSSHHFERALRDVDARALECAEELRVNNLIGRLGFPVTLLCDGSEKIGGRILAEGSQWAEAVCFLMAVLGTAAEKTYLSGVRQVRPEWVAALRALRKRAMAVMDSLSTAQLAATVLNDEGFPSGFASATVVLARALTRSMAARVPSTPEELRTFRRSLEPGGRRAPTGRFATLVFDESLQRRARSGVRGEYRNRPATSGTTLRYPSRLLVDDQRRAFSHRVRRHGGLVVIDQSGSMDVSPEQIGALLRDAPCALVVGYSHRPGDLGATANAWLLADRGRVVETLPSGNVGNGVDGPVLRWALTQRWPRETMVWVTDGQVTDSHDHPDAVLTGDCASLVREHRIRLVRSVDDVVDALSVERRVSAAQWGEFGRVGRHLRDITAP